MVAIKSLKNRKKVKPYEMHGKIPVDLRDRKLYESYDSKLTKKLEDKLMRLDVQDDISKLPDTTISLLEKRYLVNDENGNVIEKPSGLFARVAANVAYADTAYGADEKQAYQTAKTFYKMMVSADFTPNSPALMNAGRTLQQLFACFVLPISDSMDSILQTQKDAGLVHKSGGGTGFFWGDLRMANDIVSSTYGLSSGPVKFLWAYDATTHAVNQGGTRRGANMGLTVIDHPDVLQFIKLKTKEGECANFNLSVALSDDFMKAVESNSWYTLRNPKKGEIHNVIRRDLEKIMKAVELDKIKKKDTNFYLDNGKVIENVAGLSARFNDNDELQLNAREVFDYIVDCAWGLGEPGVIFIDEINRNNPTPHIGRIKATNPCGEQPLLSYEACDLGSINLANYVKDRKFNNVRLKRTVRDAVHFLDNMIDMSKFPLEKIIEATHKNRKIGLGVMGWADTLIKLGIPYDSNQALELAEEIMGIINETAKDESENMARERGVFSAYFGSIYDGKRLMRNATVTTIAPTGSISKIARQTSSSIEPHYSVITTHTDSDGTKRTSIIPTLVDDLKKHGVKKRKIKNILNQLKGKKDEDGKWIDKPKTLKEIRGIPKEILRVYRTSDDVSADYHIKMQAAFQKHTDSAVSKTINFPNSATKEDINKAYRLAYELDCKGLTVYRKGSREREVLTGGGGGLEVSVETFEWRDVKMGSTSIEEAAHQKYYKIRKGEDTFHVTMVGDFWEDNKGKVYIIPSKMFQNMKPLGTEGSAEFAQSGLDRTGRLQSKDVSWAETIKELKSVTGNKIRGVGPSRINSPSHGVGIALEHYCLSTGIVDYEKIKNEDGTEKFSGNLVDCFSKKDLKKIVDKERITKLRNSIPKVKGEQEHRLYENIHERFECPECHCIEFHKESGCSDPICNDCDWSAGKCG